MAIRRWFVSSGILLLIIVISACGGRQPPADVTTPTATAPASVPDFTPAPVSPENRTIVLATTEYPPYYGEHLEGQGVLVEIIIAAYERAGYTVTIDFLPWARALRDAQEGRYDGMFTLWHRPERDEWFVFSAPMMPNVTGFYKRTEAAISFESLEDLAAYRIGAVRGYVNPPEFEQAPYLRIEEADDDATNLRKLYAERVDLIMIDRVLARHLINTQYPEYRQHLEWLEPALIVDPQYLVISKLAPDYQTKLADFNAGLTSITADGTLEDLLAKHGFDLTDWAVGVQE